MSKPALTLVRAVETPAEALARFVRPGRLLELSGTVGASTAFARTTTAISILCKVQYEGETAAWVQPAGGPLFPPDLHHSGVDLDALIVIHTPPVAGAHGLCKAAELLLRSGAFGLVVVDLCAGPPRGSAQAWQGRLLGLARQHDSRVVLLTEKPAHADSLGALIGLRVESQRFRESRGRFIVEHTVLKNKSGAPVQLVRDRYRGPWGLP